MEKEDMVHKPSVTMSSPVGMSIIGFVFVMMGVVMTIMMFEASDGASILVGAIIASLGIWVIVAGSEVITLDETGCTKSHMLGTKHYDWSEFVEVGIAISPAEDESYVLAITLVGGKTRREAEGKWFAQRSKGKLELPVGWQVLECIECYYGPLDYDEWGKAPRR